MGSQKKLSDGATLTIYEAIRAAARGLPLKIVLLLDYIVGSDGVVAHDEVESLLDLKGRRIGVETGTISHFTLVKALEKAGLSRTEVETVDLGPEEAFLGRRVEAVSTYQPHLDHLLGKGQGRVISSVPAPEPLVDPALLPDLVRKGKN